jgi:hypothetical protein
MRNHIFVIIPFLTIAAFVILVGPVAGQTVSQMELSSYSDQTSPGDTLINSTATYDPCCNILDWLDQFYRTNAQKPHILFPCPLQRNECSPSVLVRRL